MTPFNRRDEILQIAARLFAQNGFKNTTIKDIATAAGVRSSTLYHHFESKEAIVDEILVRFHEDLFGQYHSLLASDLDPQEKLVEAIRVSFAATNEQRDAVAIFENEAEYLGQQERFAYLAQRNDESREFWITLISQGAEAGVLRDDIDVKVAYRFIRDTVWAAARWHRSDDELGHQHVADNLLLILLEGMLPRSS